MNREVPFFSLKIIPQALKDEWLWAIKQCIEEGIFIRGIQVNKFEREWSEKIGVRHSLGVSNGQDALILALRALGVKTGDKVVVPAHSFIATHNAVLAVGAIPISVDVDHNGLIAPFEVEKLSFSPTAIIVVHMHGMICDINRIMAWAKKNKTFVVEDCSQAHLASHHGIVAGTTGDIGIFSLYPTKNLGALGDAGVVVTDSDVLYKKMQNLSNYGSSLLDKYTHIEFGLNNRLDEIQASILNVNLKYLDEWNNRRRQIASRYYEGLQELKIEILQPLSPGNVWHHFCILHENRDQLREYLLSQGINTEIHYPNVAAIECEKYASLPIGNYPTANYIASRILSLPISPWHKNNEIDAVITALQLATSIVR